MVIQQEKISEWQMVIEQEKIPEWQIQHNIYDGLILQYCT